MPLFALNEDVLADILSSLTSREAWRLGQTCRFAYSLTLAYRLSDVLVPPRELHSFCAFVLAHGDHRPHYLNKLEYHYEPHDMWAIPFLTRVLQLADRLESLSIEQAEFALGNAYSPSLRAALKSCSSIKAITFKQGSGLGLAVFDALSAMVCPVTHLRLSYISRSDRVGNYAFSAMLKPFIQSLTSLDLEYTSSRQLFRDLDAIGSNTVWPNMHTLWLKCAKSHFLTGISQAFPNLRVLHWDVPHPAPAGDDKLARWEKLDFLSFYCAPPISAAVQRIHMKSCETTEDQSLAEFLCRSSPAVLDFKINFTLPLQLERLPLSLRYLSLCDSAHGTKWRSSEDIEKALVLALGSLSPALPLMGLSVHLDVSSALGRNIPIPNAKLMMIAHTAAIRLPSLRFINFTFSGSESPDYIGRRDSTFWFRLIPDADASTRHVKQMSSLEGTEAEGILLALGN